MKIGIAITLHNRHKDSEYALSQIRKFAPKDSVIVAVDDASEPPFPNTDHRFDINVGVPASKNKCIELLMDKGCEHLFLFDSDCYPIKEDWNLPYINSGEKHLSMTFQGTAIGTRNGRIQLSHNGKISEYNAPCGCMIYIHKDVVEAIGGFDPDYIYAGMEHTDFSMRCFNAGLTSKPFMDVFGSLNLFHSQDYWKQTSSSIDSIVKNSVLGYNRARYHTLIKSKRFIPYKMSCNGILLASYLNGSPDGQFGHYWGSEPSPLNTLIKSCDTNGVNFNILTDCLPGFVKVKKNKHYSPNVYRWIIYYNWLLDNPQDNVFMVDSTDVQVLKNPFTAINPNILYTGCESIKVENTWMRTRQEPFVKMKDYRDVIQANSDSILPNCGIVGGSYEIVMQYLRFRVLYHEKYSYGVKESTDMAFHNYIIWKHFKESLYMGIKINTTFKKFEINNISLFRHK